MRPFYIIRCVSPWLGREWARENLGKYQIAMNYQSAMFALRERNYSPIVPYGQHVELHTISPYVELAKAAGSPVTIVTLPMSETTLWSLDSDVAADINTAKAIITLQFSGVPPEWGAREIICSQERDGFYALPRPHWNEALWQIQGELGWDQPNADKIRKIMEAAR